MTSTSWTKKNVFAEISDMPKLCPLILTLWATKFKKCSVTFFNNTLKFTNSQKKIFFYWQRRLEYALTIPLFGAFSKAPFVAMWSSPPARECECLQKKFFFPRSFHVKALTSKKNFLQSLRWREENRILNLTFLSKISCLKKLLKQKSHFWARTVVVVLLYGDNMCVKMSGERRVEGGSLPHNVQM